MIEPRVEQRAGLRCLVQEIGSGSALRVLLLHGYRMRPEMLMPFAASVAVPGVYVAPQGPVEIAEGEYAWWHRQVELSAMPTGPRNLSDFDPADAPQARATLSRLAAETATRAGDRLVVIGFSQGGMLAMDALLRGGLRMHGLALLSSSSIAAKQWAARSAPLRDLPTLVSHGREDAELAFAAGESLRDIAMAAGARVTWVPFDGGHEIPLPVWRAVRRFLKELGAH